FAVVRRRQGLLAETETLSRQARELAEAGGMGVYVSTADANLAWVAWRRGELTTAHALAEQALAGLRAASARSPYFWTALLPLAAMAHAAGETDRCAGYLEAMTAPDQQLLQPMMMTALTALGAAAPEQRAAACAAALQQAEAGRYL
ncbi:MAG: tetratricopeptide repeat protein, partial [Chloroflexi bacterium]|nr:tetratricopeptide repeat protein [Chloroflexota bacterium]